MKRVVANFINEITAYINDDSIIQTPMVATWMTTAFELTTFEHEHELYQGIMESFITSAKRAHKHRKTLRATIKYVAANPIHPHKDCNACIIKAMEHQEILDYEQNYNTYKRKAQTLSRVFGCLQRYWIPKHFQNGTTMITSIGKLGVDKVYDNAIVVWNAIPKNN
jgi:hypothetical protein